MSSAVSRSRRLRTMTEAELHQIVNDYLCSGTGESVREIALLEARASLAMAELDAREAGARRPGAARRRRSS